MNPIANQPPIPGNLLNPLGDAQASGAGSKADGGINNIDLATISSMIPKGDAEASRLSQLGLAQPTMDSRQVETQLSGAISALDKMHESAEVDIYAVMALFQKLSQQTRNMARMDRETSMQAQVGALQNAANNIEKAAEERFKGALAAGIAQIAGGAISVGAGAVAMGTGIAGVKAGMRAGNLEADLKFARSQPGGIGAGMDRLASNEIASLQAQAGKLNSISQSTPSIGQGLSGMAGGAGAIAQATYDREAGRLDADRAREEANAKVAEQGYQQANEVMQYMQQVMQELREKLSSIQQSRTETNRSIARNI